MQCYEQHVFLRPQSQQTAADQRAREQVKRLVRFLRLVKAYLRLALRLTNLS